MRVCPKCGSFYAAASTFCRVDGAPLADVETGTDQWRRGAERLQEQQKRARTLRRRLRWRQVVVMTVCAMILARIVYVVSVQGVENQPAPTNDSSPTPTPPVKTLRADGVPTATPSPSPAISPSPSPAISPSPSPRISPSPSPSPRESPSPSPTISPSPSPRVSPSPSPSPRISPSPSPAPPVLYSISGRVTVVNGKTVPARLRLDGTKSATTTTDSAGNYSFTRLPAGDYEVTAVGEALIFRPQSYSFGNLQRNESANFQAIERPPDALYSISGRVTSNGRPAQARIRLMGKRNAIAATDGEGHYRFDGLPAGSYMVAPVTDRLNFEPRSRLIVQLNRNETANFAAIERRVVDEPRDDGPKESPKPTPTRRRPAPNRSP